MREPGEDREEDRAGSQIAPWESPVDFRSVKEPTWAAFPIAASGCITDLVASPKAGKSTLVHAAVASILRGSDWLGGKTEKGAVVIVTEEAPVTYRVSLARAGLLHDADAAAGLSILRRHAANSLSWDELVYEAFRRCDEVGARLLVVDTLPGCAGLAAEAEQDSGAAIAAYRPVRSGAKTRPNLAIICIRHARKAGGTALDAGRGSSAWQGEADILAYLHRSDEDMTSTVRVIELAARVDTPARVVVDRTRGIYRLIEGRPEEEQECSMSRTY